MGNVDQFNISCSSTSGAGNSVAAGGDEKEVQLGNLTPGESYECAVTAVANGVASETSDKKTGKTSKN